MIDFGSHKPIWIKANDNHVPTRPESKRRIVIRKCKRRNRKRLR